MVGVVLPGTSRVPALSCNKVTHIRPLDIVISAGTVVVGHGATSICPEGVEVAVVEAGAWLSGAFE